VLGAGMVGSAIAADLAKSYDVVSADFDEKKLSRLKTKKISVVRTDFKNKKELSGLIRNYDLVIGAVPGFMGFEILKNVIESGKNVVDISFFSEDPFELDSLAKEKNVTAVVDCGVAPGLSGIILGYHSKIMEISFFKCLVGGLPSKRSLPFQYKAPFSPVDVIEEYTRPARLKENGFVVVKEALSGSEFIEVEGIGTLEAFNTDGLRTLLKTMNIPTMIEKTLRYPGHKSVIQTLKHAGYFSTDYVDIDGIKIRPIDLSAKLLFPMWKLEEDEKEFTYLQLNIKGKEKRTDREYVYELFDSYDEKTKTSSMARTTGYTCTAVADLVLNGEYGRKGISPPEYIGEDENCLRKVTEYLGERNVNLKKIQVC